MARLALIHLFWLSSLPAGLLFLAAWRWPWRRRLALGLPLVVFSIPSWIAGREFWPFDFLGRGGESRVSAAAPPYRIDLVNKPGDDFYDLYFEVADPSGNTTRLLIDADAGKWWRPQTRPIGSRVYFTQGGFIESDSPYADLTTATVYGCSSQPSYRLADLDFSKPWN